MANRVLSEDYCFEVAGKYSTRTQLSKNDQAVYQKLKRYGLLDTVYPKAADSKSTFSKTAESQLDRIERKLDELLSKIR